MAKQVTRKAAIDNINSFILKKAQEDEEIPEEGDVEETPEDVEGGEEPEDEGLDVEEEAPPEGLEERVEAIEETQEVIEEGLEEHKEILEQLLDGDSEGEETIFEDFMEEEKGEGEEDEISGDEMGLEDDFLTASDKEDEQMSLRDQRRARLKKAAADTETLNDQWELEKDKKKRSGPIQPEVPKGNVPKHEMPEIFKVSDLSLEQTKDKKAWVVLDKNDKPFCVLHKGSLSEKDFASEAFAKKVILDMHKMGIRNALKKYRAAKYVKKTASAAPVNPKIAAVANNDFKRRFVRAVRLALTAMNKNLVKEIPLKAALYEILADLEVQDASRIVEAAFASAGVKHFEAAIAKAEDYLGMSDASFIELESQINDTEVADIAANVNETRITASADATELRRRARENSMPFSSSTEEDPNDKIAMLERVLPKPRLSNIASMFKGSSRG
jgi:hypothetical protein